MKFLQAIFLSYALSASASELHQQSSSLCTLLISLTDFEDDTPELWRAECEIGGQHFPLSWSENYVKELSQNNILISGESELDLIGLEIESGIIHAPEISDSIINHKGSRTTRHLLATGSKRILVVRVISPDSSTSSSSSDLSNKIFGTHGDVANLKSQYSSCSFNHLTVIPSVGNNVVDGVLEVTINQNVINSTSNTIQNAVTEIIGGKPDFADHVMYCLPPGTSGRWIAYAYTDSWLTVYNNNWCKYLSAQMHEIGHNLGLGHANENGIVYSDQTGYMGYSYSQDDSPLMCFNSYHSSLLGWYKSKTTILQSSLHFNGNLSGFVDFNTTSNPVLIQVSLNSHDYFINYNKNTKFNSGTKEGLNQVLVVESAGRASNLLAKLDSGATFTFPTSPGLILQVRSIDFSGDANIFISGFTLDSPTTSPVISHVTSIPTSAPAPSPTAAPTISHVTSIPTSAPAPSPTPRHQPIPPRQPTPNRKMDKYKYKGCRRCN